MSKQTAVDFIVDKIFKHSKIPFTKENCPTLFKFIQQAKEMEKQQIENAFENGMDAANIYNLEQYYNETFKD
jgi:hypothetical protein